MFIWAFRESSRMFAVRLHLSPQVTQLVTLLSASRVRDELEPDAKRGTQM